jgi:cytochrome-b5 reductase
MGACSHIDIKDDTCQIARSYTPISGSPTHMDLIVKRYEDGLVSRLCHSAKVGDSLLIRGPIVTLPYRMNMVSDVAMICGGTGIGFDVGITPMLQLIRQVVEDSNDTTKLQLFYANKTEDDIILRKELNEYASKYPDKLTVKFILESPPQDWNGLKGRINSDMLKVIPKSGVGVLVCGPNG